MDANIIILAAGASSRMKQSSRTEVPVADIHREEAISKPKAMMGVGKNGRPFLDYLLRNVERAGYRSVILVVEERNKTIRNYYEQEDMATQFPGLEIDYVDQRIPLGFQKPLGTADAVHQALVATPSLGNKRFTVCNSDNLYSVNALRLLLDDTHENAMIDYDISALEFPEDRIRHFALITKNAAGFLTSIIEKPSTEEVEAAKDPSGRIGVSMNIWRFSSQVILPFLRELPLHPTRKEKELPLAVKKMVADGTHAVFSIPLSEHVIDLTSLSDVPHVTEYLQREFPDF